jgi:hypothetical protein
MTQNSDVLKLTAIDLATIRMWRRRMIAAVALTVGFTLTGENLYQRSLAPLLGVDVASAEPKSPVLSQECAQRDAHYMMQMEEQGDRHGASGPKLYRAFLAMLRARNLCEVGQHKEAFALYDEAFGAFVSPRNIAGARGPTN